MLVLIYYDRNILDMSAYYPCKKPAKCLNKSKWSAGSGFMTITWSCTKHYKRCERATRKV